MTAQQSLLDLLDADPIHADDRARIQAAIIADGKAHGGLVNPNRVRRALSNEYGLTVYPRCVGATYSGLCRSGHMIRNPLSEWVTSDDTSGRNAGKPAATYRLTAKGMDA